jgi:hypothetical protein
MTLPHGRARSDATSVLRPMARCPRGAGRQFPGGGCRWQPDLYLRIVRRPATGGLQVASRTACSVARVGPRWHWQVIVTGPSRRRRTGIITVCTDCRLQGTCRPEISRRPPGGPATSQRWPSLRSCGCAPRRVCARACLVQPRH